MIKSGSNPSLKFQLLLKLGEVVRTARVRPQSTVNALGSSDPVIMKLNQVISAQNFMYHWKKIILLGCSAGGEVALRTLLKNVKYPHLPIVIAMHHKPGFKFSTRFELANQVSQTFLPVRDRDQIKGGDIYFLPSNVVNDFSADGKYFFQKPLNYRPRFRPEVDVVFTNGAQRFNSKSVGLILSGMLNDGSKGVLDMNKAGADIWIQEPGTALFKEMPSAAKKALPGSKTFTLAEMGQRINNLTSRYLTLEPIQG